MRVVRCGCRHDSATDIGCLQLSIFTPQVENPEPRHRLNSTKNMSAEPAPLPGGAGPMGPAGPIGRTGIPRGPTSLRRRGGMINLLLLRNNPQQPQSQPPPPQALSWQQPQPQAPPPGAAVGTQDGMFTRVPRRNLIPRAFLRSQVPEPVPKLLVLTDGHPSARSVCACD